jgi:hypothetical protein
LDAVKEALAQQDISKNVALLKEALQNPVAFIVA